MRLHRTVQVQEQAISADGIAQFDLGVNPLSVVMLCLRPLNDTGTLTEFARYLSIAGAMDRVRVLVQGSSVVSMTGRDLAALAYFRHGIVPPQTNGDDTNNERRCVCVPLLLGRFAADPDSCLPAQRRGDLQLEVDFDIADTGYDGLRFSVETMELLDVHPKEFERKVELAETFSATGLQDIELPIGRRLRGILSFGTTSFQGASPAPSLGRMSLLVDNQHHSIPSSDFEVAHAWSSIMGRQPPYYDSHTHRVDATAMSSTEETTAAAEFANAGWENYAYLDLDPTRDDAFSVDLSGASRANLRLDVETADATRHVPVEQVKV